MPAKVFISSGQRPDELPFARNVEEWLRQEGYESFLALAAQTLQDVDSGVIDALRFADYFLFIDFKREKVLPGEQYRGSYTLTRNSPWRTPSASESASISKKRG